MDSKLSGRIHVPLRHSNGAFAHDLWHGGNGYCGTQGRI